MPYKDPEEQKKHSKEYAEKNREKIAAYQKEYRKAHKEKAREYNREHCLERDASHKKSIAKLSMNPEWKKRSREKSKLRQREYRKRCLEAGKQYGRTTEEERIYANKYYHDNNEKLKNYNKEKARIHREEKHDEYLAYGRAYKKAHPEYSQICCKNRNARKRSGAPGNVTLREWLDLLAKCNNRCTYCGIESGKLTQDHVVPLSRGGLHIITNLTPACRSCNSRKQAKLLEEWQPDLSIQIGR